MYSVFIMGSSIDAFQWWHPHVIGRLLMNDTLHFRINVLQWISIYKSYRPNETLLTTVIEQLAPKTIPSCKVFCKF